MAAHRPNSIETLTVDGEPVEVWKSSHWWVARLRDRPGIIAQAFTHRSVLRRIRHTMQYLAP